MRARQSTYVDLGHDILGLNKENRLAAHQKCNPSEIKILLLAARTINTHHFGKRGPFTVLA